MLDPVTLVKKKNTEIDESVQLKGPFRRKDL